MTPDQCRVSFLSEILGAIDLIVKQDHVPPEKRLILVSRVVGAALSIDTALIGLSTEEK